MMKLSTILFFLLLVLLSSCGPTGRQGSTGENDVDLAKDYVRGWNILSDDVDLGMGAIDAIPEYGINHLQLSHYNIMDLKVNIDPVYRSPILV